MHLGDESFISRIMKTFIKKAHGFGFLSFRNEGRQNLFDTFSPPDMFWISFQLFFGGRTVNMIPSEKGSWLSTSSKSASPPNVSNWYISFNFLVIMVKPVKNSCDRRSRSAVSCLLFSDLCASIRLYLSFCFKYSSSFLLNNEKRKIFFRILRLFEFESRKLLFL